MRYYNLSKFGLLRTNLTWWILGLVLAFPVEFLLDYFTSRVLFYPGMGDMAYARVQQLRLVLIILTFLNVITPTVINAIEVFYTDLAQNGNKSKTKQLYFSLAFNLDKIKRPLPHILTVMLIVAEVTFVISMMIYLRQNYYNALNNSMDFLISAPYLKIIISSVLLLIDCLLIFCVLLLSFLWGYPWAQWVLGKFEFTNSESHLQILFLAFLIRLLSMLGVTIAVNFMVTFSGKFNTAVEKIYAITALLLFLVGIYIIPYFITLKKKPYENFNVTFIFTEMNCRRNIHLR